VQPRSCRVQLAPAKPRLTVGEIFRQCGEAFRKSHALTPGQLKVLRAVQRCRTQVLGGHLYACQGCGHEVPMYNSCRNRHCPTCQSLGQAKWIAQRKQRILGVPHFHVVFTLPQELRTLARYNPATIFTLLFRAATRTLLTLARDPKHLGALPGITAVLHTWTRELLYHPHVHCVVTGGGLAPDGSRWVASRAGGRYLFPIKVLSNLFRGKFLAGLRELYRQDRLFLGGSCAPLAHPNRFAALKDKLYRKDWVVYAKRPFAGAAHIFEYLGRYTHRVAISNQRLIAFDNQAVTFATKNGNRTTLSVQEFMRRFLLHVLPFRFVKMRHFGLYAPGNVNTKLHAARQLIPPCTTDKASSDPGALSSQIAELIAIIEVQRHRTCPLCGSQLVLVEPLPICYSTPPYELRELQPP